MVNSIVVVGVLACCELFLSMCNLKAAQMNMQLEAMVIITSSLNEKICYIARKICI